MSVRTAASGATRLASSQEKNARSIGGAGVRVADVGGEEIEKSAGSRSRRHRRSASAPASRMRRRLAGTTVVSAWLGASPDPIADDPSASVSKGPRVSRLQHPDSEKLNLCANLCEPCRLRGTATLNPLRLLVGVRGFRTSDPLVPNEVRYQTALHSDIANACVSHRPYRGALLAAQAFASARPVLSACAGAPGMVTSPTRLGPASDRCKNHKLPQGET